MEALLNIFESLVRRIGCALPNIAEIQGPREHAGCPIGGPLKTRRRRYVKSICRFGSGRPVILSLSPCKSAEQLAESTALSLYHWAMERNPASEMKRKPTQVNNAEEDAK